MSPTIALIAPQESEAALTARGAELASKLLAASKEMLRRQEYYEQQCQILRAPGSLVPIAEEPHAEPLLQGMIIEGAATLAMAHSAHSNSRSRRLRHGDRGSSSCCLH